MACVTTPCRPSNESVRDGIPRAREASRQPLAQAHERHDQHHDEDDALNRQSVSKECHQRRRNGADAGEDRPEMRTDHLDNPRDDSDGDPADSRHLEIKHALEAGIITGGW